MKLAKLSLATIVAVGALSTFASASSLEEAIKGTQINGFLRYRYYNRAKGNLASTGENRTSAAIKFTVPVDQNLKAGIGFMHNEKDWDRTEGASNGNFDVHELWFQYANNGASVQFGKVEMLTPWTQKSALAGSTGNGVIALYSGVPGWTFGAEAYLDVNTGLTTTLEGAGVAGASSNNVYGLAAIGAVGPVNVQVWGAKIEHVIDSIVYADISFAQSGFSLEAQVNQTSLDDKLAATLKTAGLASDDSGLYYGVKAGYAAKGFSVDLGYTQNDDKQPFYTLQEDDSDGFIFFGQQLGAQTVNAADVSVMFADLGYTYGKFGVGAGYGLAQVDGEDAANEIYVSGTYNYTKSFNFNAYYSMLDFDEGDDNDNDEFKFEARYNF